MKIIEVLVVEQEKGLFLEISRKLPLVKMEDSPFRAFRLEIDPELLVYFYLFDSSAIIPIDFREDILPHLKRILILAGDTSFRRWNFSEEVSLLLEQDQERIPTMVVLVTGEGKRKERPALIFENGLFLGKDSRLFNWERGNDFNIARIWTTFWSDLRLAV
ncbi:MAG: hypothetical protein A2Y94_10165 [Caldithrix sp. RBG_13_44_9]|nr:MAG: hypothetical protein A2Y94_10165 [Caldithrix sp. RBG_13_44_9]